MNKSEFQDITIKSIAKGIGYLMAITGITFLILLFAISKNHNELLANLLLNVIFLFVLDAALILILIFINKLLEEFDKNILFKIEKEKFKKITPVLISVSIVIYVSLAFVISIFGNYVSFLEGKNNRDISRYNLLYSSGKRKIKINSIINQGILTKKYSKINNDVFLGYKVTNGTVKEAYVCFLRHDNLFCLKGMEKTYYDNVNELNSAFDTEYCNEVDNQYICSDDEITASITKKGKVEVYVEDTTCIVDEEGTSYCSFK